MCQVSKLARVLYATFFCSDTISFQRCHLQYLYLKLTLDQAFLVFFFVFVYFCCFLPGFLPLSVDFFQDPGSRRPGFVHGPARVTGSGRVATNPDNPLPIYGLVCLVVQSFCYRKGIKVTGGF